MPALCLRKKAAKQNSIPFAITHTTYKFSSLFFSLVLLHRQFNRGAVVHMGPWLVGWWYGGRCNAARNGHSFSI